jgi:hypothetical protein
MSAPAARQLHDSKCPQSAVGRTHVPLGSSQIRPRLRAGKSGNTRLSGNRGQLRADGRAQRWPEQAKSGQTLSTVRCECRRVLYEPLHSIRHRRFGHGSMG